MGKTTIAASLAIAATHERKRVLVVTIDPAKRLAEAFGYSLKDLESSGEPLALSPAVKTALNIPADASLSVGLLNPKYVLDQILEQVLTPEQATGLKKTQLFRSDVRGVRILTPPSGLAGRGVGVRGS